MNYLDKYGEWALITGGSSGIGEGYGYFFASKGMNVILTARRKAKLNVIADSIRQKYNVDVLTISVDLTDDNSLEILKEKIGNRQVGVLVNNAGFGTKGDFIKIDSTTEEKMVVLNCLVPVKLTHYFAERMAERNKGAIIFLGSTAAQQPSPYMTTYAATKVFNEFMGNALWNELKKYNIDVLTINPGSTKTEFHEIANLNRGPVVREVKDVIRTTEKSLGKKPSAIDGFLNGIGAFVFRFLPKSTIVNITSKAVRNMFNVD